VNLTLPHFILLRYQPVPLHQPPHMFWHHVLDPGRVRAPQVENGFDCFHLHPRPCEFQSARADVGLQETDDGAQPVGHSAERHAACGVFQEAFDGGGAFAFVGQGFERQVRLDQGQQFCAPVVSDNQPLVAIAAHVADSDIGQTVGVIDAGLAGEGEEIGGKLADREGQERDQPRRAAIIEAQFNFEISAEFEVADRVWFGVEQVEEGVEILGRCVVGAGGADDVDTVEAELGFQRA
jgi:hypothetical protein